jgi:hypothetical protein
MNRAGLSAVAFGCLIGTAAFSQRVRTADVPAAVKTALQQKYPSASGVGWEKEKGNYEANWGGASKEDNSVLFTPPGNAYGHNPRPPPATGRPAAVADYVRTHYPGAKIAEAGKVTDAEGRTRYEAEVKGKDLLFDEKGDFIKFD